MGEIHVLCGRSGAPAGARVRQLLEEALREGRDIGPRGQHIAVLVRSLDRLVTRLEASTRINPALSGDDPERVEARRAAAVLIESVQNLTDHCWRTYVA